jgi:putative Mg2+ transporter-C (MgtC) family protein
MRNANKYLTKVRKKKQMNKQLCVFLCKIFCFFQIIRIFVANIDDMDPTFDFILRIFVAALLGGVIGLEREYRDKSAGFRTHFLVALGSALFMVVSAYGFEGALVTENHRLDVSRIAAQVVSGIGFIGAGMIIFQKNAIRGLTTAAGVWVTAAIGLTCGAGMYVLALSSTFMVLLGLEAFNFFLRRFDSKRKGEEE